MQAMYPAMHDADRAFLNAAGRTSAAMTVGGLALIEED
jgi:hypothetical protein